MLVASTDGVGTKVELAARTGRVRGTGMDIVNHCINDVLVQGARPLFFLDYLASSHINAEMVAEVVSGMSEACAAGECVLLGGETAEMPGVYAPGAFDIAGTLVGVVDKKICYHALVSQRVIYSLGLRLTGRIQMDIPCYAKFLNGCHLMLRLHP